MSVAIKQVELLKPKKLFRDSAFSRRKRLLSIDEKIDSLELRKNIELSLIEDDEGKTIPIAQAFEEIKLGLVSAE